MMAAPFRPQPGWATTGRQLPAANRQPEEEKFQDSDSVSHAFLIRSPPLYYDMEFPIKDIITLNKGLYRGCQTLDPSTQGYKQGEGWPAPSRYPHQALLPLSSLPLN
jgi:hypothetical protein